MVNINFAKHNFVSFKANVMPKNQAEHINNVLKSGKSVDIFCHSLSDEDTFNSATAFYSYLKTQGIQPRIIASGGKNNYGYDASKYNIVQAKEITANTPKSDVALCVDFSSKDRLAPNVIKYLDNFNSKKIVGIDHHDDKNKIHPSFNQITKIYEKNMVPEMEAKNYYIDSSARSNCGIIYRFFEALGVKPNKEVSQALLVGLKDDVGKNSISLDKNTKEVKEKLTSSIPLLDLYKISTHFKKKNKLSQEESKFKAGLDSRTEYSKNGKLGFVEIKNDDIEWNRLGRNSSKTSTILGDYRKELLSKNKNLEAVAVFYPCDDEQTYKMSITSNNDYALKIVDNVKENSKEKIVAGGHQDRCGGTIMTSDPEIQAKWVNKFITAAENINYQ